MALLLSSGHPIGDTVNPLDGSNGGASIFLDDQCHQGLSIRKQAVNELRGIAGGHIRDLRIRLCEPAVRRL